MDNVNENINDSKGLLHFKEKSWSSWIKEVTESRVYRLPYQDMSLYGIRPEIDTFSAVICSTCGIVVKAPALKRHIELRHPEETQSFVAPKQVPVKKSRPNILRKPSKSPVPVENAVSCTSTNAQATTVENNTSSAVQSIIAVTSEANIVTVNTKNPVLLVKSPSTPNNSTQLESTATATRRKSPSHNERKRTRDKDKEADVEKGSSSQESSSLSSARTTPKPLQKRNNNNNNNNSESSKSSVRSTNSSSSVKSSSKQTVEKYVKKSPNVTLWGGQEEVNSFQMIYSSSSTAPTSVTSNVNSIFVLANGQQPNSVRCNTETGFTDKSYPAPSTSIPAPANEWSNNHIEKMLFSETDMGDSLLPTLVPNETPEPLPESSSTPQVLTERPPPEPPSTPPAAPPPSGTPNASVAPTPVNQSPNIPSIDSPILDVDMLINSVNPFKTESTHQLLKVMPTSAPPFSFKVSSSNPVYILSPKEPALPAVNLNVNSESTKTVIAKQMIHSSNPASVLKPRAVKVPITVQMPLQEKVTNITFYKRYPKPIALSNFSGKKVGGALIFNSKRVNVVRNDFKTVLSKKGRSINTVTLKTCQPGATGSTIYTAKPLGPNNNCRFAKTISVIPNLNTNALLTHRPNILRASVPKHSGQHVPKILASGLKRVATSSQQNDCKHLLLTQGSVNGQCFLGKMIVHPRTHEGSDHSVTDATPHVLDKVVPVNIK